MKRKRKHQALSPSDLDLHDPQHLEAIRFACYWLAASIKPAEQKGPLESLVCRMLVHPKSATKLLGQLVERAGVPTKAARVIWFGKGRSDPHAAVDFASAIGECTGVAVRMCVVPERIAGLLALPRDAGPELVLGALRGAS